MLDIPITQNAAPMRELVEIEIATEVHFEHDRPAVGQSDIPGLGP